VIKNTEIEGFLDYLDGKKPDTPKKAATMADVRRLQEEGGVTEGRYTWSEVLIFVSAGKLAVYSTGLMGPYSEWGLSIATFDKDGNVEAWGDTVACCANCCA